MTKNERAYIAILETCVLHNRPQRYQEWDVLFMNRTILGVVRIPEKPVSYELTDGEPFGYVLRGNGAEILPFFDSEWLKNTKIIIDFYSDPMNIPSEPNGRALWFFWDGSNLIRCDTGEELWERINKTYNSPALHRDEGRTRSESH